MKKITLPLITLGLFVLGAEPSAYAATWTGAVTGTVNWNGTGSWDEAAPNSAGAMAIFKTHTGAGNLIVKLQNNITLNQLQVRSDAIETNAGSNSISIGAPGDNFTITMAGTTPMIEHRGGYIDTINAHVIFATNGSLNTSRTWTNSTYHGILTLEGGMTINNDVTVVKSSGDGEYRINGLTIHAGGHFSKTNGNLYISGNRNLIEGRISSSVSTTRLFNRSNDQAIQAHTFFAAPSNTGAVNIGIGVSGGAFWLGGGANMPTLGSAPVQASYGTSNFYIASKIQQTGGDINFGDALANSESWKVTSNVTFYAKNLDKGNGTLRLQFGDGTGTTRILGGDTINGKATSFSNATTFTYAHSRGTPVTVGMRVFGEGIAEGTYVTNVSGTTITLSAPTTSQVANTPLMFAEGKFGGLTASSAASNVSTVTVNNAAGIAVGHTITGAGIANGVTVTGISGTTLTLSSAVNIASGAQLRTYAPSTLSFGGSTPGTSGTTTEWLRGVSAQGASKGQIVIDPSVTLELTGRSYHNISDNYSTNGISNWVFHSIKSDSNSTTNTIGNVTTRAGDPFVSFNSGYTNITTGSVITINGESGRVLGIYANNILLDRAMSVSSTGVNALVQQYTTLRNEIGAASMTVGNYSGVDDYVDTSFSWGGSTHSTGGTEATFYKVGSNTLTLAGHQDNSTFRLNVQEGTVVLAKNATAHVHANSTRLIIGDADSKVEVVRIGGSFDHQHDVASGQTARYTNFNDQIHNGAHLIVAKSGFLDLNGFTEGVGILTNPYNSGDGGDIGNSSVNAATLILTEGGSGQDPFANPTLHRVFNGNIRDGGINLATGAATPGGVMNLTKAGGSTAYLGGNNTYSGVTKVFRGTLRLIDQGQISNTSGIKISNSTLYLDNFSTPHNDRIADDANILIRSGTLTITQRDNATINVTENFGKLELDGGHNILRISHDRGKANTVRANISDYIYKPGSMISIVENSGVQGSSSSKGIGLAGYYDSSNGYTYYSAATALNAAAAYTQFTVTNLPNSSSLVGGAVQTSSGTYSYGYNRKNLPLLMGATGGHYNNSTREFMTVETINGVNYIRPLTINEYSALASGVINSENAAGTRKDVMRWDVTSMVNANLAYNSARYSAGRYSMISPDKVVKLGDGNSALGYNPVDHVGAGGLILMDWSTNMTGEGTLDFGSRSIWIRNHGSTTLAVNLATTHNTPGDDNVVTALNKSGGDVIDMWGKGLFNGQVYVTQGGLRVFNSQALGYGGAGNELRMYAGGYDGDTIALGNGVVIGSITDPAKRKDAILEIDGRLSALDQNNVLGGNLNLASVGEDGITSAAYLRVRRNSGILTIAGDAGNIEDKTPDQRYAVSPTFTQVRNLYPIADNKSSAMVNITGQVYDRKVGGVPQVAVYQHDKLNMIARGGTDPASRNAPITDFHVNVADGSNATGFIQVYGGTWFRLLGNWGTGVKNQPLTQGGVGNLTMYLRSTTGDVDAPNQVQVFSMLNRNSDPWANPTHYNVNQITWADNTTAFSPSSYGILANEGKGKVIIGNSYGSLDTNSHPDIVIGKGSSYLYRSEPTTGEEGETIPGPVLSTQTGTTINLAGGSFTPGSPPPEAGMFIQGNGVPAGTKINSVTMSGGNYVLTLSASATVTNNDELGFFTTQTISLTGGDRKPDVTGQQWGNVLVLNGSSTFQTGTNLSNIRPGMFLTGTNIPNNTYVMAVYQPDPGGLYPQGAIMLNNRISNTTASNILFNDAIPNDSRTARYTDVRLYAAPEGELDLRLRLYDDGNWNVYDETGAVVKIGRGDVRLSGAHTATGELDAGAEIHGGRLILDYSIHSGRKVTASNDYQAPLVLGGGELWMIGAAAASNQYVDPDLEDPTTDPLYGVNTLEQIRGLLHVRPGATTVRVTSGGVASTRLDLGVPNNLNGNLSVRPIISSGGTVNFWEDSNTGGSAVITLNIPAASTNVIMPWSLWADENGRMTSFTGAVPKQTPSAYTFLNSSISGGLDIVATTPTNNWNDLVDPFYLDVGFFGEYRFGNFQEGGLSGNDFNGVIPAGVALRTLVLNTPSSGAASINTITSTLYFFSEEQVYQSSDTDGRFFGNGGYGMEGGALLVTHEIGNKNKVFKGANTNSAMTGAYVSKRFHPDFMKAEETQYNLLIHNHANPYDFANPNANGTGGLLVLDVRITDPKDAPNKQVYRYIADTYSGDLSTVALQNYRMNFVHGGTGTTMMMRARSNDTYGYEYSGSTYFNGGAIYSKSSGSNFHDIATWTPGTLWVADPNKLGKAPTVFEQDNFFFNGGRLRIDHMYGLDADGLVDTSNVLESVASKNIVLNSNRGITIGGQGAWFDVVQPTTTFTINSKIAVVDNAPVMGQGVSRPTNIGVGDITKEGAGTLALGSKDNTFSGRIDIMGGTVQANIGDSVANAASNDPVIYRIQDNVAKNSTGHLGSSFSYMDGTYVNTGTALRFRITGNTDNDALGNRYQNGSAEWITLDGGTLGTTMSHTGGSLEGMIRVRQDSVIDVMGASQVLRLNSREGMLTSEAALPGQGKLTKIGLGSLELWENNSDFKGDWEVKQGRVIGMSQGNPYGIGTNMKIGDATQSSGEVEVLLGSRHRHEVRISNVTATNGSNYYTLAGQDIPANVAMGMRVSFTSGSATNHELAQYSAESFNTRSTWGGPTGSNYTAVFTQLAELPLTYTMSQNIEVLASGQKKTIGAANSQSLDNTGSNWDRYHYNGNILLNDKLHLSYKDKVTVNGAPNAAIARGIANAAKFADSRDTSWTQVIALNGALGGAGSLQTEIVYEGASGTSDQANLRTYFEMNGVNAGWTGSIYTGNGLDANKDNDMMHVVRFGSVNPTDVNSLATNADNDVIMSSNSIVQAGGKNVTIGNLKVGIQDPGTGAYTKMTGIAAGSGAFTGTAHNQQTIVIENASDVEGTLTVVQEESADWDVLFRDGATDPHHITNVNNTNAAQRNKALNVVKAGGVNYNMTHTYDGTEAGIAVMTQNNTYTGVTTVAAGNLQVGRGNTSESGQLGWTGSGATTVMAGAAISGTGIIQGTAGITNHTLRGIMRPGDLGGAARGTLLVNGNLTTADNTSNISFNIHTATKNGSDLSGIGVNVLNLNYTYGTVYTDALNAIATNWGSTNPASTGNHDHVEVKGKFTLGGETTVQVIGDDGVTYAQGDVYNLFDWNSVDATTFSTGGDQIKGGSLTGANDLLLPLLSGDLFWDTTKFLTHGLLIVVAIPEPSKGLLIVVALGALVLRRRRAA